MAKPPDDNTVFVKEMGINHADFFRILPRALGADDYAKTGNGAVLEGGGKRLEVSLGPEGKRTIALLALPVTMVTMRFTGYGEAELAETMKRFDLYFRRGGG